MKFQTQMQVLGMKASKGTLDDGTVYDSTKIYTVVDLDASKGNTLGQGVAEYVFGDSREIERFRAQVFPFLAVAEMEIVSNGKVQKTVVRGLKPAK